MEYMILPVDDNALLISCAKDCDKIEDIAGVIPVFKSYSAAALWYNDKALVEKVRAVTVS